MAVISAVFYIITSYSLSVRLSLSLTYLVCCTVNTQSTEIQWVHVILWKTAFVGGDKAHGLDTNTRTQIHTHTLPLTRLLALSEALRGFHNGRAALESHAPDGY